MIATSQQQTAWEAGGYAIWLTSPSLAQIIKPVAQHYYYQNSLCHPVIDGHITLIGNINKYNENSNQRNPLKNGILRVGKGLRTILQRKPLELSFEAISSNPMRPSQTLCLVARETTAWKLLRNKILEELTISLEEREKSIHASIIYNYASLTPYSYDLACELIKETSNLIKLPLRVTFRNCVVMETKGTPDKWRKLL